MLRSETPLAVNVLALLALSFLQYQDVLLTVGLTIGSLIAFLILLRFQRDGRGTTAITIGALLLITLLLLGVPKAEQIGHRNASAPPRLGAVISVPPDGMTDSVVQQEEAGRALLRGQDPYGYDYTAALGINGGPYPGFNPATHHFAYLPGTVLLSAAGSALLGDHYDGRLWYFPALVILVISTYLLGRSRREGIAYVALTVLNPLYLVSWLWSSNDILFIAPLALSAALLQRDRPVGASLSFMVSLLFKSFTAVLVPFYVFIAIKRWGFRRVAPALAIGLIAGGTIILPFIAWSPTAFFRDTVLFLSAGGPDNYPITGYSLGAFILRLGLVHDPWQPFPTWIFQMAVALPFLLVGLARVWQFPDRTRVFLWPGLCLLMLILTSRFAQHNYFVFPGALLILAAWSWLTNNDQSRVVLWTRVTADAGGLQRDAGSPRAPRSSGRRSSRRRSRDPWPAGSRPPGGASGPGSRA